MTENERWISVHDDWVWHHGDDSRPDAVERADAAMPQEISFAPGARWPVDDPMNFVQVFSACGLLHSGAAAREISITRMGAA